MKLLYFWIVALFLTGSLAGCGPDINALHDEVMVIHDDVMPRMGEMHQLRISLERQMSDLDSVSALPYRDAIQSLHEGEDMMWTWMNAYKRPTSSTPESVQYLQEQKVIITTVAEKMTSAIDQAKTLTQ